VDLRKLRWYLQMCIDFEETFKYLQSMSFPVARIGEPHTHDHCLPSLAVKEDGTLMLSAEDLVGRNMDCLAQAFRDLFKDVSTISTDNVSQLAGGGGGHLHGLDLHSQSGVTLPFCLGLPST